MAKKSGLGKGLDALFSTTISEEVEENEVIQNLKVSEIEPNRDQPRRIFEEDTYINQVFFVKIALLIHMIFGLSEIALYNCVNQYFSVYNAVARAVGSGEIHHYYTGWTFALFKIACHFAVDCVRIDAV